jgi:predicted kinase
VPRLVLTCGVAGSGKSTYARSLADRGWLRLSIDVEAHRRGFTEHPLPTAVTDAIVAEQREQLVAALRDGADVVVDYSFWSRARREEYRAIGREQGADVQVVWFDVPRAELVRRLRARAAHPGPDAVEVSEELLTTYLDGFEEPGADETDVVRHPTSGP